MNGEKIKTIFINQEGRTRFITLTNSFYIHSYNSYVCFSDLIIDMKHIEIEKYSETWYFENAVKYMKFIYDSIGAV
jgi:hypothetical protein